MAQIRELDGKRIDVSGNCFGVNVVDILKNLLGGYQGKTILEIGCGVFPNWYLAGCPRTPVLGASICRLEKGLVYGLDKGFEKIKRGMESFKSRTGVIPISGKIEDVDKIFEGKQFDAIISRYVLGEPTYNLNWDEMFKKLYPLTASGGFHCHYKLEGEGCCLKAESLEETGFQVLHYFEPDKIFPIELTDWFQTLVMKKI